MWISQVSRQALALVSGGSPLRVEAALFDQMLLGWRRQQLSRRLGSSLIDRREQTVRRFGEWTALNWLRKGAGAVVLGDLAAGSTPISHAGLDAHPQSGGAAYLRHVLVAAQVLPARDESLAQLESWVATTVLTNVQHAEHRRLLQAYATWRVLRRARRRAARNSTGRSPTSFPRTQLLVAARFLDWLDQRGVTLAQCSQGDVDSWLADGPAGYPVPPRCPAMLALARVKARPGRLGVIARPLMPQSARSGLSTRPKVPLGPSWSTALGSGRMKVGRTPIASTPNRCVRQSGCVAFLGSSSRVGCAAEDARPVVPLGRTNEVPGAAERNLTVLTVPANGEPA